MVKKFIKRALRHIRAHTKKDFFILLVALALFSGAILLFWVSSFRIPDLDSFESRRVSESTKIYDRTGEILLYDVHSTTRRTVVPSEKISPFIKHATVSIEDIDFYTHGGIKISSILRAVLANFLSQEYSQGGSTITQQVVKNALLTTDKKISRKLKEWVLAPQLEKVMTKDEILTVYLNEIPYGGNIYGVEEASKEFFGKKASDVTLVEAAYLAAIPQATTYYSPYGKNREALENRKNTVLERMKVAGFITETEYKNSLKERVEFLPQDQYGIKAPHFVFFVRDELKKLFGEERFEQGGLKIITTLDYGLQTKAEELVKTTALENEKNFNAENAGLVALDPKTGEILSMVGSRDYFDKKIDGNFNITTAYRQPGSTMKPIVYAKLFEKGYTPETVLFDLETEFSSECTPDREPINPATTATSTCYHPQNYDELFRGPISIREALAQSINVPAIKSLYLAGIRDSLNLAKEMGITSLTNADRYGLTLVLGGGEVSPLELTSAYGVFAHDGMRVPYRSVLSVTNSQGNTLPVPSARSYQVLPANVARTISDILSDNEARVPAYGRNSVLNFPNASVAVKTGTTNDYRDAWTIGYTPNIVIGVWAGNNDNTSMEKKVAGQIVAPLWSKVMREALSMRPREFFTKPERVENDGEKPIMRGVWQGGETYVIDTISGKLATEYTPNETKKEVAIQKVHSILYWVDKNNPLGPPPQNPSADSQFERWEKPVRDWAEKNGFFDDTSSTTPVGVDDVHVPMYFPTVQINNIDQSKVYSTYDTIPLLVTSSGRYPLAKAILYINDQFVAEITSQPFIYRFSPKDISSIQEKNTIRIVGIDSVYNRVETNSSFTVNLEN
jgi:penicillin-binding protein 1C